MINAAVSSDQQQAQLDAAVTAGGTPGIIAEARLGANVWSGASGLADVTTARARNAQERFRIGSLSKAFTATVILQLESEGKLNLDDTLQDHLPDVAADIRTGNTITLRHLLSHTSGLYNVGNSQEWLKLYHTPQGFSDNRTALRTPAWLVEMSVAQPPCHDPGQQFSYSNGNFYLAGMIIEKVTGQSYAQEVARVILEPLEMSATYLPAPDEFGLRGLHPRAYSTWMLSDPEHDAPVDATEMSASWAWAAGGLVSSLGDMSRFVTALAGGTLLPPEQHRQMWATVSVAGSDWIPQLDIRYGLGIYEQTLPCGLTLRGGGGGIFGSFTYAMSTRDGNHSLVSHVNNDWSWLDIFTSLLEKEFCPPLDH